MKAHFLSIAVLICASNGFSQTSKGSIMVGGNVGFGSESRKETNIASGVSNYSNYYRNTSFNPVIGYFVMDNLAVGVNLGFSNNKTVYEYSPTQTIVKQTYMNKTTAVNLFATKYFMLTPSFAIYAGISGGIGRTKNKTITKDNLGNEPSSEYKGSSVNVNVNAGLAYFPTKHIGVQAGIGNLGWSHSKYDDNTNKNDYSSINANINAASIYLGVYYFFGR